METRKPQEENLRIFLNKKGFNTTITRVEPSPLHLDSYTVTLINPDFQQIFHNILLYSPFTKESL